MAAAIPGSPAPSPQPLPALKTDGKLIEVSSAVAMEDKYVAHDGDIQAPVQAYTPTLIREGELVISADQLVELFDDVRQGKLNATTVIDLAQQMRASSPRFAFADAVAHAVAGTPATASLAQSVAQAIEAFEMPGCSAFGAELQLTPDMVKRDDTGGGYLRSDMRLVPVFAGEYSTTPEQLSQLAAALEHEPTTVPQPTPAGLVAQRQLLTTMRASLTRFAQLRPDAAEVADLLQRLAAASTAGPLTASDFHLAEKICVYARRVGGDMQLEHARQTFAASRRQAASPESVQTDWQQATARELEHDDAYQALLSIDRAREDFVSRQAAAPIEDAIGTDWVQDQLHANGISNERAAQAYAKFVEWSQQGGTPAAVLADAEGRQDVAAGFVVAAAVNLQQGRHQFSHHAMESLKVAVANHRDDLLLDDEGKPIMAPADVQSLLGSMEIFVGERLPFSELSSAQARGGKTTLETIDTLGKYLTATTDQARQDAIPTTGVEAGSDMAIFQLAIKREAQLRGNDLPRGLRLENLQQTSQTVLQPLRQITRWLKIGTGVVAAATVGVAFVPGGLLAAGVLALWTAGMAHCTRGAQQLQNTEASISRVLGDVAAAASGDNEAGLVGWLTSHWKKTAA